MSENTKQQVRDFYDQIGWSQVGEGVYQNARYEDLRPVSREYIHKCHMRVKDHIAPSGDLLLDAGSGPVQYPEYVAYSENYKHRVCADISITALKEARHRLGDHGLYVVMDVANLPFKSDAFDAVVSLHTIHHLPLSEHRQAYVDLMRVLKPDRTMAIVNGWHSPRLMTMTEPLIRFARLLAGRGRKHKKAWADVDDPTGTFVSKMTPEWLKQELGDVLDFEIYPWRSLSTRFLRWFIRPRAGGRFILRSIFWLEERFPRFFGENGQYPVIEFRKHKSNGRETNLPRVEEVREAAPAPRQREEAMTVDRVLQVGESSFDFPKSASQWFKLRKNRRLFFWWLFHRVTSPLRVLPNFVIVGTMKGGTTSMFQYLAQHPRVNPPFRKEIKFFDIHFPKGLLWYRAHYPLFAKMTDGAL
ncbi:MAG: class I SAM-dependent methyltransferase, partial [Chloroflexota bacterium]